MALDQTTLSNLYRKYLNKDATPGDLSNLTAQGYTTPSAVESLLSNTSKSVKSQTMSTIDRNIASLQPQQAYQMFGGQLPDYGTFQSQNPQLQQAQSEYDTAFEEYGFLTKQAAAQPARSRAALKSGSYFFGESYDDLRKRFGDPNSPYFIPDVKSRDAVIGDALQQRNATLQDVITKISSIYDTITTAAGNELAGRSEKVQQAQKLVEKTYDTLMGYFGERRAEEFQQKQDAIQHGYRMKEIAASKAGVGDGAVGDALRKLLGDKLGTAAEMGFTREQNEVGGYSFYGPDGPMLVDDWVKATGLTKTDALAGSRDYADRAYSLTSDQQKALGTLTDNIRMDPDIKDFVTIRDNYNRIKTSANLKSGQGDLAVIFSYMKVLDPTSVVREQEYKNAADAVGKIPQLANIPRQWLKGNKLTDAGRKGFIEAAESLYNSKLDAHQKAIQKFRGQAEYYGINPDIVLQGYGASVDSRPPISSFDE